MKKFFLCVILGLLLITSVSFAKANKNKDPKVQSTEGVEVTQQISKNVLRSKTDSKNAKLKTKNRNKYLKNINKLNKLNNSKRIKERDLDYYNKRLRLKENMLDELNSVQEKGENEE